MVHRFTLPLLGLICVLSALEPVPVMSASPMRVDLRPDQTPLRVQGGRGTCIIHSVVAAMESAIKRSGRDVDLSEDTFMYFVKQFWLAPIDGKPADACENQVGGTDGGGGVENLNYLAGGLAIPEESAGHPDGYDYKLPFPWFHDHWKSQFNVDSWNLSPRRLLPSALRRPILHDHRLQDSGKRQRSRRHRTSPAARSRGDLGFRGQREETR